MTSPAVSSGAHGARLVRLAAWNGRSAAIPIPRRQTIPCQPSAPICGAERAPAPGHRASAAIYTGAAAATFTGA